MDSSELSDIRGRYKIKKLLLVSTGNLYSVCIERFTYLLNPSGVSGVIVPISSISTPRMYSLMELLNIAFPLQFLSNFAVRPGKLFTGVDMNLTVIIGKRINYEISSTIFTTRYNRWNEEMRSSLFHLLAYTQSELNKDNCAYPKFGLSSEYSIFKSIEYHNKLATLKTLHGDSTKIYYHSGGRYFRKCTLEKISNEYKEISIKSSFKDALICLISSSFYYWLWLCFSDCYHVTKGDVDLIPVPASLFSDNAFTHISKTLLTDLYKNSQIRIRKRTDGTTQKEMNFYVGKSKHILDEIDELLAKHYGFTEEELDFIINYDIKYRMGGGAE